MIPQAGFGNLWVRALQLHYYFALFVRNLFLLKSKILNDGYILKNDASFGSILSMKTL